MPLYRDMQINADTRLCIWQITEELSDFAKPAHLDFHAIGSATRQREILAVYAMLQYILGRHDMVIEHNEDGQPFLRDFNLSISHTKGWAALVISKSQRVAIDIEYISDRVTRIARRFIRPDENGESLHHQLVNWSTKETVYKYFSEEKLHYFDMRLLPFSLAQQGKIEVADVKNVQYLTVDYELNDSFVLTYAVENQAHADLISTCL